MLYNLPNSFTLDEIAKKDCCNLKSLFSFLDMSADIAFIVMAAGIGSRYDGKKQLDTFGEKNLTIAEYNMLHAIEAGFKKFFFVINEKLTKIFHERLENFLPNNCTFSLIDQRKEEDLNRLNQRAKPWGTGHAVMCCDKIVDCNFCVTNADDLYGRDAIFRLAKFLLSKERQPTTFVNIAYDLKETLSKNGTVSRGIISVDENFYLKSINELTDLSAESISSFNIPKPSMASMNLWGFSLEIFKLLNHGWTDFKNNIKDYANDEFLLSSFVNSEVKNGRCKVKILQTNSKCHGVTYKTDRESLEKALNPQLHGNS